MRAWSALRQLLAATLCAVLVAPAYPSESTLPRSSSTPSHTYDAATLSKTRVWGSNEKILLHFSAVLLLSEKQHWGSAKCSWKIVVGSLVTYDYDAFGNLLHSTATGIPPGGTTVAPTPNEFLFAGEQFDTDLGLYYNRARYLNVSTGRFLSMDAQEGDDESPLSLHRYLYLSAEPVDSLDPSGHDGLIDTLGGIAVQGQLFVMAHPILTQVSLAVLVALAPADFVQSLPPGFGEELQFLNAVESEVRQLTTIERLLKSSWLQRLKAGSKFESWMLDTILAKVAKQAEQLVVKDGAPVLNNARIKGSAVIDAIINNVITEFKTSFGAVKKYQLQQFAQYAQRSGQALEYVFLYKPSPQEIETLTNWVKEVGSGVGLQITYILEGR